MIGKTCSRCFSNSHRESQLSYPSPRAPKKPIRLPSIIFAGIAFAGLCLSIRQASSQTIEYRSLPELIESGSEALLRGNYPSAAQAFNSILENYQEEPIWLEGQLPTKILPLAGFASHKSAQHEAAIKALELYLESFASEPDTTIFARYTLASSLLLNERETDAREAFAALREAAGQTPFRDLATLREAQLSEPTVAIHLLENLVAFPVSKRLATHARLKLITLHLEQEDPQAARALLLDTPWTQNSMPELATLSFLATEIADTLIDAEPASALQAYQLVEPKSRLIEAQRKRIRELQETYRQLAPRLRAEQSMWSDQFRQSLDSLENQLSQLESMPGYQDAINLRKARCFNRIGRPLEAWILLEQISTSASEIAREAHLDWISTARQMRAWNASALIAQNFLLKYPTDTYAPQVLFWVALSQIEQEAYEKAASSLRSILASAAKQEIIPASHYYLGYCQFMLGNTFGALASFTDCSESAPNLPISGQAQLWKGICYFTTNDLVRAIEVFRDIQSNRQHTFLHAEAAYREIAALYALGELENSKANIETWLRSFPIHPRQAEAQLLYGDILSELGLREVAIQAYSAVETDDTRIAFAAIENCASLLLQLNRPAEARTQLETYRESQPTPPEFIGRFTLLLAECLAEEEAQREIGQAIHSYGNLLEASGLVELISLYNSPIPSKPEQPTLSSRQLVAQIQNNRQHSETTQAKLKALELASAFAIETLPPEALIEAGNALANIGSLETPLYFERVLKVYPRSNYTEAAHLGMARHFKQTENPNLALAHLLQLSYPSPNSLELKLALETKLQLHEESTQTAERLLSDRQAKPSQKAKALIALGQMAQSNNEPSKAYNYFQRVFTLYRGEIDEVVIAYQSCIHILNSEERYQDARRVAAEFLAQTDLSHLPAYQEFQNEFPAAPIDQP